jgi:hypothetical protein
MVNDFIENQHSTSEEEDPAARLVRCCDDDDDDDDDETEHGMPEKTSGVVQDSLMGWKDAIKVRKDRDFKHWRLECG